MILKIRKWDNKGKGTPAPEHVVECDRYTIQKYDADNGEGSDARYFWHEGHHWEGDIKLELIVFNDGPTAPPPQQIFLINAVVYVMNNEGKTIDTYYAK